MLQKWPYKYNFLIAHACDFAYYDDHTSVIHTKSKCISVPNCHVSKLCMADIRTVVNEVQTLGTIGCMCAWL